MSKIIVISVKPEFANLIFDGSKKIELRKSRPKANPGDLMIVYSTSPEMAVLGICKIKEVLKSTPDEIWINHSEILGIDKVRFDEYYSETENAVAIVLDNVRRFKTKMPLKKVKEVFPSFTPPQTFKYFNRSFILESMKA
ncbi:ASCH domain-containing protein [Maribacter arenosus]|uniref:ASCH domain-containing protein n=1 Tax=Maribacter arenosus TaxID=1854708 RepID=A0ABR7VG27_9FLAO|nr:ASCH domain-containing protein [Maribacter arenosus]MBD0851866.1 ASCH domain-containing protein [Maribacter arenosus]